MRLARAVGGLYQQVAGITISVAVVAFLLSLLWSLRRRDVSFLQLVAAILVLTAASRLALLAFMNAAAWPGFMYPLYISPVYPMLILFVFIVVIELIQSIAVPPEIITRHPGDVA